MIKFDVDGHEVEVSESAKIALTNKFKADGKVIDQLKADADEAKEQAQKAQKERDAAQAKLDEAAEELEKLRKADADRRADALGQKLAGVLGKDYQFKGKSEAQINRDALAKLKPNLKLDGLSDDYIKARVDGALDNLPQGKSSVMDAYDQAPTPEDKTDWGSRCDLFDDEIDD